MKGISNTTLINVSQSIFAASLLAFVIVELTDSSEAATIAWITLSTWCVQGGAELDRAGWVRSTGATHSLIGFCKDALALTVWPLVARHIHKTRGKKK